MSEVDLICVHCGEAVVERGPDYHLRECAPTRDDRTARIRWGPEQIEVKLVMTEEELRAQVRRMADGYLAEDLARTIIGQVEVRGS